VLDYAAIADAMGVSRSYITSQRWIPAIKNFSDEWGDANPASTMQKRGRPPAAMEKVI